MDDLPSVPIVVLDANVLYPAQCRDLFMRLAANGMIRVHWKIQGGHGEPPLHELADQGKTWASDTKLTALFPPFVIYNQLHQFTKIHRYGC